MVLWLFLILLPVASLIGIGIALIAQDIADLRRHRSMIRRQCPGCGYDLRTQFENHLLHCPECGEPIRALKRGEWRARSTT